MNRYKSQNRKYSGIATVIA